MRNKLAGRNRKAFFFLIPISIIGIKCVIWINSRLRLLSQEEFRYKKLQLRAFLRAHVLLYVK